MKALIKKNIQGWKVTGVFLLAFSVYLTMLFYSIPKVKDYAKGMEIPDLMPAGYTKEYITKLFTTLGEAGRSFYLHLQLPLDLVYPLLFGLSYCLILAYFLQKLGKLNTRLFYLTYLPLLAGAFDYLENAGLIMLLKSFPEISAGLVKATSSFSVLKSSISMVYFIILIITLLLFFVSRVLKKKPGRAVKHN